MEWILIVVTLLGPTGDTQTHTAVSVTRFQTRVMCKEALDQVRLSNEPAYKANRMLLHCSPVG